MRIFRILTISIMFLASSLSGDAKNYVVCVGLSDYPGFMNDLTVSASDATYIANLFRRNGNSEVYCVTNRNATVTNVVRTMSSIYSKAGPADMVMLFFSGHGTRGALRCYDGPLKYSQVTDCMKLSKSRKRLIFADACMSGGMRSNNRRTPGKEDVSIMFFLSSRTQEPSREIMNLENSAFTYYLGRGLRGYADTNKDRTITARELFDYVSGHVISLTGRRQHPVMWGNFSDLMPVIRW